MLQLYNTLTKKIEEFKPRDPELVTLYACGPTVYSYAHIGNFRTYITTDILVRTLKYLGYQVKFVMNITDVGHLVSDADTGEDKLEKGAKREGKTAWDIAKFYTEEFLKDSHKLNLLPPDVRPKPTEHIKEQITMVQTLLDKGYAYKIGDGIYFDTSRIKDYGKLTGQKLEELKEGARVEVNPQKKNPTDFALWKFSPKGVKRDMEWESPWGVGFPGWHIECSAMSMKYLGEQIDIHTGGVDLIPIHHTNEIAQSEAATGKVPFVRFWVHGQFMLVDGEKMSKSKGNFYSVKDIEAKGYDPKALRYLCLTAQYRSFLNFTWQALESARQSLAELRATVSHIKDQLSERSTLSNEKLQKVDEYKRRFNEALENDLNTPQALAVVWEALKSNIPSQDKYDLLLDFDEVLGFDIRNVGEESKRESDIPAEIQSLLRKRNELRVEKKFSDADKARLQIEHEGFVLEDTPDGTRVKKKTT